MLKNIKEHTKLLLLLALIMLVGLSFAACDNGELGDNGPDTYIIEVIIEGIANENHAEFFSVLADGESGIDQFSYENNALTGDITGLSGATELTLVIDDNLEDGEYKIENEIIDVDSDDNEAKFEVEFFEKVPKIADIDTNNDVEDISVEFGTAEDDAIAELVEDIVITDTEGSEHTVSLDWSIKDYDSETDGDYTAIGAFDLPEDVEQTDPAIDLEVEAIVTVNEEDTYSVSVNYDNGAVEGYGNYTEGEEVELAANPDEGYKFVEWTGHISSTDNPLTFDMPAENVEFTANFNPTIDSIDTNGDVEDISVDYGTSEDDAIAELVEEIVITDAEGSEYTVSLDWSIKDYDSETDGDYTAIGAFDLPEDVEQTDPAIDLEVEAIVTVNEEDTYSVSVNYDNGAVEGYGNYTEGEEVELAANPDEGYKFVEWTGYISSTDNPLTFDMPAENVEFTVHFEQNLAYFEITIDNYQEEVIGEGAEIVIEYSIENIGDVEDTQDIDFFVNNELEDNEKITLDAGGIHESEFIYETKSEDVGEELNVAITNNDSRVERTIIIKGFAGGRGTESDPYLVENAIQLDYVREHLDAHFKQIEDIDLSGYENWEPIGIKYGEDYIENKYFNGTYDGKKYKITNIKIKLSDNNVGFFAYTNGANLSNIKLKNIDISANSNIGSLIGYSKNTTIENVQSKGEVYGYSTVGGLVGRNNNSTINSSNFKGEVSASRNHVGGLVATNKNSTILNSYSEGSFIGTGYSSENIGGLIGNNIDSEIKNSFNNGFIEGEKDIGGLVGNCEGGLIENSYSNGEIHGSNGLGGLIGQTIDSEILNSHSTGNIYGESSRWSIPPYIGGLIGRSRYTNIIDSYSEGDAFGHQMVGGLIGSSRGDKINRSYSIGDVKGKRRYTGGLIGVATFDTIVNISFGKGNVIGSENVGGLIGSVLSAKILNSYSTGNVKGSLEVGGLVGSINNNAVISKSYSFGDVVGDAGIGGLIGIKEGGAEILDSYYDKETTGQSDEGKGIPKSTEEMIQQDTFEPEWNFDDIWTIDEGYSYPYFLWQDNNIPTPPE